jgi:drug/metabolite transporter (DMT)-like permease
VSGKDWLLLILSGLLFGGGQFCLIRAFAMASGIVLAPFTYIQIVAAIIFGALVFGEMPDFWTLVGMILIVLAGVYVLRRQAGPPDAFTVELEPRAGP